MSDFTLHFPVNVFAQSALANPRGGKFGMARLSKRKRTKRAARARSS